MSKHMVAVVVVLLTGLATPVAADPITLSTLRLGHLTDAPTESIVLPVGGEALPTFFTPRTDFTLFTGITPQMAFPGTLQVVGPLGTSLWTFPDGTDVLVTGLTIPRVYRPTVFRAEVALFAASGERLDGRTFEWVASSPVPEPSTWLLLLTGVGLMVWTDRRRRR